MLNYILAVLAGYLLGSISVAVLLSKGHFGSDVRESGSGNAGATNVARVFGMNAGVITMIGDMVKTAVSGLLGYILAGNTGLALACAGCLIGHCWPLYFGFKGGKGVSVSACIAVLLDWRMFLIVVAWFFIVFFICRRVSLCSISASVLFPPLYYLLNHTLDMGFAVCCLVTVTVVFLHRGNISRLINGTEPKFQPKSKK